MGTSPIRSETYRGIKRYEEALADGTRAIELAPEEAWAHSGRGATYLEMKRYHEALSDCNRSLQIDPKNGWTLGIRGETYRGMERYEETLPDLDRAIERDTEPDWLLYQRALVYRALNKTQAADTDLIRAIDSARTTQQERPQESRIKFNLGLYHLAMGQAEEAQNIYRETLAAGAPVAAIRGALTELENFLDLFPSIQGLVLWQRSCRKRWLPGAQSHLNSELPRMGAEDAVGAQGRESRTKAGTGYDFPGHRSASHVHVA